MGGACCSSENPSTIEGRNTEARRPLVDGSKKQELDKRGRLSAADDDSITNSDQQGGGKTSIFEQLQDADSTAMGSSSDNNNNNKNNKNNKNKNETDLGLSSVNRNDTTEDDDIDNKFTTNTSDNFINAIQKQELGVQSQPSYADAEAGINRNAYKMKNASFSMKQHISTSPTLKDNDSFNVTKACEDMKEAFAKQKGKDLVNAISGVLTHLSERQRLEVVDKFVGPNSENLKTMISEKFSGDTANVLIELCRSSADNDAYWLRQSLTAKLQINTTLISEILCSRTNEQIADIVRAYNENYNSSLEDGLKQAFPKSGKSYVSLMSQLINFSRKESEKINEKEVRTDIRKLYGWLEETNNWEKNKQSILDLFAKRSWQHINAICDKYTTKSMHDLQVLLEKKFGKTSKTGEALQVIIQMARDRFAYFALLLRKAMKGLGTDDGLLIRTIVSRSGIDLREIIDRFSRDFGEGKTVIQWIKGDTSGSYQTIVLSICGLDDKSLDEREKTEAEDYRRRTIVATTVGVGVGVNADDSDDDDDMGGRSGGNKRVSGIGGGSGLAASGVGGMGSDLSRLSEDQKEIENMSNEDWDEYIATSPTIRKDNTFQPLTLADHLHNCLTSKDKKQKKKNKEIVIRVITRLTNDQRQDLFRTYKQRHDKNMDVEIKEALGNKGKGKSLYALLALLQTPEQQDAYSVRKAIKGGDWKLLSEILCTRTNGQIERIIDEYKKTTDKYNDLVSDVSRLCGKKTELKIIFETIVKCQRPQTMESNYQIVKDNVDQLNERKGKFGARDKELVANILAKYSWVDIKEISQKFGTYSEKSFEVVLKDVFGSSHAYQPAQTIYLMATNGSEYWCRLLKESMTGMSTNQQLLIRVLISRSEIDLGEINNEFSRKQEFGGGKTLKQWICDKCKGSFQHLLLRIAGLQDDNNNDDDNKGADSENSVDTSIDSNHNLIGGPSLNNGNYNRNSVGIDMPSEADYKVKIISQQSISTAVGGNALSLNDNTLTAINNINNSGGVGGNDGMNDDSIASFGNESTINTLNADSSIAVSPRQASPREAEQVDIGDMGAFMKKKMTDKTVSKLWTHIDEDGSGMIEADEVLSLMTFTAVLYNAYKQRVQGTKQSKKMNKDKIKKHLTPLCTWISTTKMVNENKKIGKADFTKLFGTWLQEYAQNHPQ